MLPGRSWQYLRRWRLCRPGASMLISAGSLSLFRANPAKSARGSRSRAFEHPGAVKRAGATRLPAADWRFSVA